MTLCIAVANTAHGQCAYDVQVIYKHPSWSTFSPVAISDDGTVVGTFVLPSGPAKHAFKWHASTGHVALPKPAGAYEVQATAISSNGIVAGEWRLPGNPSWTQLVVWDGVVPKTLPITDPPYGLAAKCIASNGMVGGYFLAGPPSGEPFLCLDGEFLSVAAELTKQFQSYVFCANDHGSYGGSYIAPGKQESFAYVASIGGGFTTIPTPSGYIIPSIRGLNSRRHGALWAQTPSTPENFFGLKRAFLWDGSQALPLGLPPETDWSSPAGMNDLDQMVGVAGDVEYTFAVPLLWFKSATWDVRDLIVLPVGHELKSVVDINNSGVILGAGRENFVEQVAYILTPTTIDEDIDLDCAVSVDDLFLLFENWGDVASACVARADVDRNGVVDGHDLGLVLGAWSPPRIAR